MLIKEMQLGKSLKSFPSIYDSLHLHHRLNYCVLHWFSFGSDAGGRQGGNVHACMPGRHVRTPYPCQKKLEVQCAVLRAVLHSTDRTSSPSWRPGLHRVRPASHARVTPRPRVHPSSLSLYCCLSGAGSSSQLASALLQ